MAKRSFGLSVIFCMAVSLFPIVSQLSAAQEPAQLPSCGVQGCHSPVPGVLRGIMIGLSPRPRMINIDTGKKLLVRYGDETKLVGEAKWSKVGKYRAVAITYIEKDGELFATRVSAKPETCDSMVSYTPKPDPAEFSLEEFKKVIATHPADKVILDVREKDELEDGAIPGSRNAPLSELKSRLSELPRDKEIVTHCVTGVRAEMASIILNDNGFNAHYLNAKIYFDNGKYSFRPPAE